MKSGCRHFYLLLIILYIVLFPVVVGAQPKITADSYLLMEAESGQILLAQKAQEKRPPASTTKILTSILALDLGSLNEMVTVSEKAAAVGESSIYLQPYERFTLIDLIKGALIKSGNDATVAIAEQLAGDEALYLDLVNRKAKILGALNTNFTNPHGLTEKDHYSSALDLAVITQYALTNSYFASIVNTKETTIQSQNFKRKVYLKNTNRLLWVNPQINGVKTGTTHKAGKCLVTSASKNGITLIAVVLHSDDRFGDAKNLLNYGFDQQGY